MIYKNLEKCMNFQKYLYKKNIYSKNKKLIIFF